MLHQREVGGVVMSEGVDRGSWLQFRGWWWKVLVMSLFLLLVPGTRGWCWHGYVLKVLDGDSLQIKRGNRIYEIRLYGIDAPEYRQAYGQQARSYTSALTLKKTVTVLPRDVDRYGRTVALVKSRGRLVNRELVRKGLAWVYPRYCRERKLCAKLDKDQQQARKARRGLWRGEHPQPPWQWKRRR
ncbi:thermonuclease family protein [Desulfogranum mediterraneum]|uniref:thermonuclease family protein n=1 Tax=Desulfogranum mediterraneum TaxID=160661 RepID=UPI000406CB9A|nr:thermonuclease family protein [Desulfogranum mediterraneum]